MIEEPPTDLHAPADGTLFFVVFGVVAVATVAFSGGFALVLCGAITWFVATAVGRRAVQADGVAPSLSGFDRPSGATIARSSTS